MLIAAIVFLPFAGAAAAAAFGRRSGRARDISACALTALILFLSLFLPAAGTSLVIPDVFASGLHFSSDGFRNVWAIVSAVMWFGTTLFSQEYFAEDEEEMNGYWFFVLATLGATEGVMLSADFMTTFVFFEILSFTSFTWVMHDRTTQSVRAGYTYLFIAIIGGLVLFMGLLLLQNAGIPLPFVPFGDGLAARGVRAPSGALLAAGCCILFGFGCKAGMVPVHVWLPKAHPVAPSPASALLSGILTKVGVYGILMAAVCVLPGYAPFGWLILLLGTATMVLGAVLAIFSVNLKRTLACSSMSQIGFILTGVGMYVLLQSEGSPEASALALPGLLLHMLNHSMIKLTLFLAAGVSAMREHTLTLDDLRGFGRKKRTLAVSFALGALGISGVPLFGGYLSKTLLHESIVAGAETMASFAPLLRTIEVFFLVSGGCTFAYMLKLFICLFIEKNASADRQARYDADPRGMSRLSTAVVFGSACTMVVLGVPQTVFYLASYMTGDASILNFKPFSFGNLKGSLISLAIGASIYLLIVRRKTVRDGHYVNYWPAGWDLEERVYRPMFTRWLPGVLGPVAALFGENRLLRPTAVAVRGASGSVAALFGENRFLRPLARFTVFLSSVFGRVASDSLDALIILLRKSVLRARRVKNPLRRAGRLRAAREATEETIRPLTENFSFALMMTCIGILLILGTLVVLLAFGALS